MPWDRSRYPADWEAIVARVGERAGGRCECQGECGRCRPGVRCEARNKQPHPVTASLVVLTTAHLDHDPSSADESRLRHLCQRCHLTLDAPLHAQHARATRRRRREEGGQGRLPGVE